MPKNVVEVPPHSGILAVPLRTVNSFLLIRCIQWPNVWIDDSNVLLLNYLIWLKFWSYIGVLLTLRQAVVVFLSPRRGSIEVRNWILVVEFSCSWHLFWTGVWLVSDDACRPAKHDVTVIFFMTSDFFRKTFRTFHCCFFLLFFLLLLTTVVLKCCLNSPNVRLLSNVQVPILIMFLRQNKIEVFTSYCLHYLYRHTVEHTKQVVQM